MKICGWKASELVMPSDRLPFIPRNALGLLQRRRIHVDEGDVVAVLGEDVGDAVAHGARTDDCDLRHVVMLCWS